MLRPSEMAKIVTDGVHGVDGAFEKLSWTGDLTVTEFHDMHDRSVDMLAKLLYEAEIAGDARSGRLLHLLNMTPLSITQSRLILFTERLVRLVTARQGYNEATLESIFYIVSVLHMVVSSSPRLKRMYVSLCDSEIRLVLTNPALHSMESVSRLSRDKEVDDAYVPFEEIVLRRLRQFVKLCVHPTDTHRFRFRSDIY